jgi:hypothetical protein
MSSNALENGNAKNRPDEVLEIDGAHNNSLDASGGSVFLQLAWCGEGCFDSRRRVNSAVRRMNQVFVSRRQ